MPLIFSIVNNFFRSSVIFSLKVQSQNFKISPESSLYLHFSRMCEVIGRISRDSTIAFYGFYNIFISILNTHIAYIFLEESIYFRGSLSPIYIGSIFYYYKVVGLQKCFKSAGITYFDSVTIFLGVLVKLLL